MLLSSLSRSAAQDESVSRRLMEEFQNFYVAGRRLYQVDDETRNFIIETLSLQSSDGKEFTPEDHDFSPLRELHTERGR